MKRPAPGRVGRLLLGGDGRDDFGLNDGLGDRGVQHRSEDQDPGAHGLPGLELAHARSRLVNIIVYLDFPPHAVDVANLDRAVRSSRQIRKKEAAVFGSRDAHHAAPHPHGSSLGRDVRIDLVAAANDDVVLEEGIEIAADGHLRNPRAAHQAVDRWPPVVLQSHDVADVVFVARRRR